MFFVQRDDVVENFAAATAHPAFRGSVLPGRLHTRLLGIQTGRLQKLDHLIIEFRVAVEDDVAIRGGLWKRFTQLLEGPLCRRVRVTLKCRILRRPCSMTKKQ